LPNPISTVKPNANLVIGSAGDRPLTRHPDLAVLALDAIASWSNVESFMLNLFIELLGGNKSIAASIFLALEAQSTKAAAINAASLRLKHRQNELRVLKAILAIGKTNEKDRNKFAHWQWGDSPDPSERSLACEPKGDAW
jgi:hypothetical protein